jgi:hypothetical protein
MDRLERFGQTTFDLLSSRQRIRGPDFLIVVHYSVLKTSSLWNFVLNQNLALSFPSLSLGKEKSRGGGIGSSFNTAEAVLKGPNTPSHAVMKMGSHTFSSSIGTALLPKQRQFSPRERYTSIVTQGCT